MGAQLAKVVLSNIWGRRLSAEARLLFAHMAVTALDRDKPPMFWAGRQALVMVLYGDLAADPRKRDAQYRNVRKHLEQIRNQGGIRLVNEDAIKSGIEKARYEIRVLGRPEGEELPVPPGGGTGSSPGGGPGKSSGGGTASSAGGGTASSPRGIEPQEQQKDLLQEAQLRSARSTHLDAREAGWDGRR